MSFHETRYRRPYNPPAMPKSRPRSTCHSLVLLVGLAAAVACAPSLAQMTVEITGVGSQQYPIAVASFKTDDQGHFRVSLPPGHYTVSRKSGQSRIGRFGPFDVDVTAGQVTKVQWSCDSGMR